MTRTMFWNPWLFYVRPTHQRTSRFRPLDIGNSTGWPLEYHISIVNHRSVVNSNERHSDETRKSLIGTVDDFLKQIMNSPMNWYFSPNTNRCDWCTFWAELLNSHNRKTISKAEGRRWIEAADRPRFCCHLTSGSYRKKRIDPLVP